MFEVVKTPDHVRVFGIDPSTQCMGVCVIDVDMKQAVPFKLIYVNTIYGDKNLYDIPAQFDDRAQTGIMARSYGMMRSTDMLLRMYKPDQGVCEDNYLGASPLTWKQLIQAVSLQSNAFFENDVYLSYVLPRLAKQVVGGDFKGSQKEDIQQGVLDFPWLDKNGLDLTKVDHNASDSVAITLWRCIQIAASLKAYEKYLWLDPTEAPWYMSNEGPKSCPTKAIV